MPTWLTPNRIVAFLGPYVAIASGAIADWLLVHVHFLGLFHVGHSQVAGIIAQVAVFGLTALATLVLHNKWLSGWIAHESHLFTGAQLDAERHAEADVVVSPVPFDQGATQEHEPPPEAYVAPVAAQAPSPVTVQEVPTQVVAPPFQPPPPPVTPAP